MQAPERDTTSCFLLPSRLLRLLLQRFARSIERSEGDELAAVTVTATASAGPVVMADRKPAILAGAGSPRATMATRHPLLGHIHLLPCSSLFDCLAGTSG